LSSEKVSAREKRSRNPPQLARVQPTFQAIGSFPLASVIHHQPPKPRLDLRGPRLYRWHLARDLEVSKVGKEGKVGRLPLPVLCFLKPKGNDMLSEVRELSHGVEELAESVWVAKVDVRVEERVDNILQSERRRRENLEQGNGKRRSSPSSFDRLGRA